MATDSSKTAGPAGRRSPALLAAGVVLAATAIFHLSGLAMAASWLDGVEGRIVELLWITPAASWLIIAGYWLHSGWRGPVPPPGAILATALLPLVVAVPLLVTISPAHPGGYLLIAAAGLALATARRRA
jgi:hypothetical protein